VPRSSRKAKRKRLSDQKTQVQSRSREPAKLKPKTMLHPLEAKTAGQQLFLDAIKSKPVTICDGPAGTGKTFISFGCALREYVKNPDISRIVVVRPTITAGDEPGLGFLPGSLDDKMAPFLAPILRDSAPLLIRKIPRSSSDERFINRFGNERSETDKILSSFDIEIVPLHLMRGRTFHNAFVILDEAQNCTMADFKLFLTRIGKKSQVVIEGDASQCDRPEGSLVNLMQKLQGLDSVANVRLTGEDIIRNPIIYGILKRLNGTD